MKVLFRSLTKTTQSIPKATLEAIKLTAERSKVMAVVRGSIARQCDQILSNVEEKK